MVEFFDQLEKVAENDILEMEKLAGLKFPNEYKEHIMQYNGGYCTPNVYSFVEDGKETESDLAAFLSISNSEYDNLKEYIIDFKIDESRIPLSFLPIAIDSGGNLICICCEGEDLGKIFFWDHEREGEENIHYIAPNIQAFLNSLKELD